MNSWQIQLVTPNGEVLDSWKLSDKALIYPLVEEINEVVRRWDDGQR